MDSNQQPGNMEQDDDVYGLDELPHFYGDMDSDEGTADVEQDGLNELPYFFCDDSDVPDFRELKPPKKETTNLEEDGIDRISEMPDNVLSKILCFLPTKHAMAAKILSTRWGSLFPFPWISPIVIDLDDTWYGTKTKTKTKTKTDPRMYFETFVDKLFNETLIKVPCLDVLKLKCDSYNDEKKLSWVSAALRLNVRELSFQMYLWEQEDLFHVLNGYTGLARLEFRQGSDLKFPYDFTLPNLRTLVLSDLNFGTAHGCSLPNLRTLLLSGVEIFPSEVQPLNDLINSCLALEVLSFKHCYLNRYGDSSFCLSIQCSSLKNLTIEDCISIWECSLAIDAPKLQVLLCKGFAAESYTVSNPLDSLLSAHIDIEFSYSANGVEEFVTACSNAVDLYLCAFLLDALHLTRAQLPMFKNLNRLALGYIQLEGWTMLPDLLRKSPNLEKLVFKQGFCLHDGGYSSFESLITMSTPCCLELHVKEIEFLVFDEKEDEIKLVEYFMNNGKAIETLKLHCLPFKFGSTRERLVVLPRQSKLVFQPR